MGQHGGRCLHSLSYISTGVQCRCKVMMLSGAKWMYDAAHNHIITVEYVVERSDVYVYCIYVHVPLLSTIN